MSDKPSWYEQPDQLPPGKTPEVMMRELHAQHQKELNETYQAGLRQGALMLLQEMFPQEVLERHFEFDGSQAEMIRLRLAEVVDVEIDLQRLEVALNSGEELSVRDEIMLMLATSESEEEQTSLADLLDD